MLKAFEKWYLHSIALLSAITIVMIKEDMALAWLAIVVAFIMGVAVVLVVKQEYRRYFEWRHSTITSIRCQGEYYHYGLPKAHHAMRTENDVHNERIVGSAMRHPSGLIFAGYEPARHHHVIRAMDQVGMAGISNTRDNGFMTNTGRYVGRVEASLIAQKAGQVKCISHSGGSNYELYSEDLWP